MSTSKFIKRAGFVLAAIGTLCTFFGDRLDRVQSEDEMREAVRKEVAKQLADK